MTPHVHTKTDKIKRLAEEVWKDQIDNRKKRKTELMNSSIDYKNGNLVNSHIHVT